MIYGFRKEVPSRRNIYFVCLVQLVRDDADALSGHTPRVRLNFFGQTTDAGEIYILHIIRNKKLVISFTNDYHTWIHATCICYLTPPHPFTVYFDLLLIILPYRFTSQ